jgi:hypothetical protein
MTYRKFTGYRDREAFSEFFEDFFKYAAGDWTITTTEAGTGSATEALGAGPHGQLVVTNAAGDNDLDFFQSTTEFAKFVVGKKLQFGARFKVSDATESEIVFGLQITDTTPLAVSDGIYFRKDDGDTLLDCVVVKDSTASTLEGILGTSTVLADDTWIDVEFYYDGASDDIDFYVNGLRVGSLPITNAPDDEDLAISFGIQNGEAVAKVLTVDYIFVRSER